MRRLSALLVALLMMVAVVVGPSNSASAASKQFVPKPASWTCFTKKCFDFKGWYVSLPFAVSSVDKATQVNIVRALAVDVYGGILSANPSVKRNIDDATAENPQCVQKIIYEDAYSIAKSKDGKIDAMMKVAKVAIKAAVPGPKPAKKAVGAILDAVEKAVGKIAKVFVSDAKAKNGMLKAMNSCYMR